MCYVCVLQIYTDVDVDAVDVCVQRSSGHKTASAEQLWPRGQTPTNTALRASLLQLQGARILAK